MRNLSSISSFVLISSSIYPPLISSLCSLGEINQKQEKIDFHLPLIRPNRSASVMEGHTVVKVCVCDGGDFWAMITDKDEEEEIKVKHSDHLTSSHVSPFLSSCQCAGNLYLIKIITSITNLTASSSSIVIIICFFIIIHSLVPPGSHTHTHLLRRFCQPISEYVCILLRRGVKVQKLCPRWSQLRSIHRSVQVKRFEIDIRRIDQFD